MVLEQQQNWRRTNNLTMKNRETIWRGREEQSDDEEQRRRIEEEQIWVGDWTIWVWFAQRTQNIVRKNKWNSSEVLSERLPMRGQEFSVTNGFSAADEMHLSPLMGLPIGFLMFALVSGWGLYVWVWECSGVSADGFADGFSDVCACLRLGFVCLGVRVFWSLDADVVKYDHKPSFRNLISTYRKLCFRNSISMWLHVEKSPCQTFVAQDLEY